MKERLSVPPEKLRRTWDPAALGFVTTEEIPAVEGLVGQERAVSALKFGLVMRSPGYNIFVAGSAGTGKTSYSASLVTEHARSQSQPEDWVYVHNFDRPDEPIALAFPAGQAPAFARAMEELIRDASGATGRALNSKEAHGRRDEIIRVTQLQIAQVMEALESLARQTEFALSETDKGFRPVPLLKGQPMTEEQYEELSPDTKREIKERAQELQAAIAEAGRRTWELEQTAQVHLRELDAHVAHEAVAPLIRELKERNRQLPRVVEWLSRAEQELVGFTVPQGAESRAAQEAAAGLEPMMMPRRSVDPFARFRVNVLVHRDGKQGAPVVMETNPTYANLFGNAEFVRSGEDAADNGVMHIKPGAIHRANGGYLILQAADILRSPHAWEALKRALSAREARIEVPGQEARILPVDAVKPQPIPLDVKVILVGSAGVYHTLYAYDEGFRKQFKLKAEFDTAMDATPENAKGYARFISSVCRREHLRHFTPEAVARVMEHSHRLADDQERFTARFNEVVEVIYEANAWASQAGAPTVGAEHVVRAVREKAARSALSEVAMQEMIRRGTILFDVSGGVVGQVNGLTVMNIGDYSFGSPSRITARVYTGRRGILHIEREIAMSGQIHDKGVLTLSAFLGDRFAQSRPLALSASIAFEQTYMPVDGDSASSTELYALLSALADLPIDQGIAVTGSVNQRGQIQPIGGVNEKIEGFFRVCQLIGMTGRQGVMIPRQNLSNLMLSDEVVAAVKAGQFHIWSVSTIEEGIEILTGTSAGNVFERVDRRLEELARTLYGWDRGESDETP